MGILTSIAYAKSDSSQIKADVLPYGMSSTIDLMTTTSMYEQPDNKLKSPAALSPQSVKVLRFEYESRLEPDGYSWLQIQTSWLGKMWIKLDNTQIGEIQPLSIDVELASDTPLYDRASFESANGATLSPQKVHVKRAFISPSGFNAFEIETSWLGDQWLIQPELKGNEGDGKRPFHSAISPDYGDLMKVNRIKLLKLANQTFIQASLVIQEGAWNAGRISYGTDERWVYGELVFWNKEGDTITRIPYSSRIRAGESGSVNLLLALPEGTDLSKTEWVTLNRTFPLYFGLPTPPGGNLQDQDGKVRLGMNRVQHGEGFSVGSADIQGKVPGTHAYWLTLTFYDQDDKVLGTAKSHLILIGPSIGDDNVPNGEGNWHQATLIGDGDWTNYQRIAVRVDSISVD
ncbi:hypothetical protein HQN90_36945 [Paenibacillus alba]|nr:hypothetical protein [Paenibacillus alba]